MPLTPPLTNLAIHKNSFGFYAGFNAFVAVGSKILIGTLILWAAVFPDRAAEVLRALNNWLLTYATAEPIFHFGTNPDVITGLTVGETAGNVRAAYQWSFLHWGL